MAKTKPVCSQDETAALFVRVIVLAALLGYGVTQL